MYKHLLLLVFFYRQHQYTKTKFHKYNGFHVDGAWVGLKALMYLGSKTLPIKCWCVSSPFKKSGLTNKRQNCLCKKQIQTLKKFMYWLKSINYYLSVFGFIFEKKQPMKTIYRSLLLFMVCSTLVNKLGAQGLAGAYTINQQLAPSSTNFVSFNALATALTPAGWPDLLP